MSPDVQIRSARPRSSLFRVLANVPWILIVILYLVLTTLADIEMTGVAGYIFLAVGLFVLFAEFIKSGDITTPAFVIDLVVSVLSVATTAALITLLVTQSQYQMTFFHGYGAAIVLADAIVGPYNAFRTAKRNLEFGGGMG
jgi:hypothetical protein